MTLDNLYRQSFSLASTDIMPCMFIGHGSPMNALEENEFTNTWRNVSKGLPKPVAVVCISAHWETRGTYVTGELSPKTIHDFYGFPKELYMQEYLAPGDPSLAREITDNVTDYHIKESDEWGLDHGTWSVLKHLYPGANIPVIQISLDHFKDTSWHYDLGKQLSFLRSKGVLVIGSGNMIHNLRLLNIKENDFNQEHGYDWAFEINMIQKKQIVDNNYKALTSFDSLHKSAKLAIPTLEHYIPMLYILGLKKQNETVQFFNDKVIAGSLSMTSFIISNNE
ncbi:4,5-DOPA dioxygenase extradiol [Dysgonomonas sp. Marseille-P4361]|uniref:4,5-DOPA-extradiol-dioxygenase n=1 Tax=Dysgonomonas sp. Marseille-P4361 TaxID=2161820 RepID=UPI000D559946|nr:4,5-DOPA dioxygenase extradiol [Dysgonomonas sp. Marseille-P4361]